MTNLMITQEEYDEYQKLKKGITAKFYFDTWHTDGSYYFETEIPMSSNMKEDLKKAILDEEWKIRKVYSSHYQQQIKSERDFYKALCDSTEKEKTSFLDKFEKLPFWKRLFFKAKYLR